MGTLGTACHIGAASDGTECSYCSPLGGPITNFREASFTAASLTCEGYQLMLDRGWIRDGTLCYKPDLKKSCCPAYTIKLDVMKSKPSVNQRKLINRWNRFVLNGDGLDYSSQPESSTPKPSHQPRHARKSSTEYSLIKSIHASENHRFKEQSPAHEFDVTLELPSYTAEKYRLFKAYQEYVHQDPNPSSYDFRKFLVMTPLQPSPIPYTSIPSEHMPKEYGTYHQMYHLDGKLIAMGVLDILPSCISSVYFIYDPTWERYSLGKLSLLREIALVNEIYNAGITWCESLYLGYYVHTCQKVKYKAEYPSSYLLDPEDWTWWPIGVCQKLLDDMHYACFSHPEHSLQAPPKEGSLLLVSDEILETLPMLKCNEAGEYETILFHEGLPNANAMRVAFSRIIYSLGIHIAKNINFVVEDWE